MRSLTVCFLFFAFVLSVCCVQSGGTAERKRTQEELFWERIRSKADTAYLFCQENDMNTSFCFLVDMRVHSGKKRFFVWDFETDTILSMSLCAHGYGMNSTEEKPVFSNVSGSYCSSLGKYKTGIRSYSNWGIHVHYKLHGLEETNSRAFERIIVLHSHSPVPSKDIYPYHLPLGYSQGCPVVDDGMMQEIDDLLKVTKKPSLLWVYVD